MGTIRNNGSVGNKNNTSTWSSQKSKRRRTMLSPVLLYQFFYRKKNILIAVSLYRNSRTSAFLDKYNLAEIFNS